MTEFEHTPEGVRQEIIETINFANKILEDLDWTSGEKEDSLDPSEVFVGPILDLNDETLTEEEKTYVEKWIQDQLGSKPEDAPVKGVYKHPDGQTTVTIYDVPLGIGEGKWFLSRWQNQGEKPSYVFWQEDVYEWQIEGSGYTEISQDK